jgi:NAD(P)-dependent dehydrogenase (short-subunit alcohol dehydrogenase family)
MAEMLKLSFSGNTALVTGARSGIGAATVDLLVESGISVIALDVAAPNESVSNPLIRQAVVDVTDEALMTKVLTDFLGESTLDYLVNCAGIHQQSGLESLSSQDWHRMLDVNLVGAALTIKSALPWLRKSTNGAVVNVTSLESDRVVALINPEPVAHYAASKAGLAMLTVSMARDLSRYGIRVNSVAPGFIQTPMAFANHAGVAELPEQAVSRVPLGRYGQATEVASAIAFLLSEGASYITGSSLLIDGGFSTT